MTNSEKSRRTTGGFGPPFPLKNQYKTLLKILVHSLFAKRTRKGENKPTDRQIEMEKERWERDKGDGGLPRLISQVYYIFPKYL